MRLIKKICLFNLLFLTVLHVEAITFEEALKAAFTNNPEWFTNQAEKQIAEERNTQAKMMFLPDIQASIKKSNIKSEMNIPGYGKVTQNEIHKNIGVSVSQNLFNGFATLNTARSTDNSAKAAFHKLKYDEQTLIVKVLEAYSGIWVGHQKVVALKKKAENLKTAMDAQISALEAGLSTQSEVSATTSSYQKAIYECINAETELSAAASEFAALTGLKSDDTLELPDFDDMIQHKKLDNLIKEALECNHSILYAKYSEKAAANKLDASRGKLLPSCAVNFHSGRSLPYPVQQYDSQNSYTVSLEVTVPIFENRNGNTYSEIAIANQDALKARFSAKNAILNVEKECVTNWNVNISADAMIKASRSAVKSAELASRSVQEESKMGVKSNTDVLTKENQLLESRVDLANSKKQKLISAIKLLALTGKLSLNYMLKKR